MRCEPKCTNFRLDQHGTEASSRLPVGAMRAANRLLLRELWQRGPLMSLIWHHIIWCQLSRGRTEMVPFWVEWTPSSHWSPLVHFIWSPTKKQSKETEARHRVHCLIRNVLNLIGLCYVQPRIYGRPMNTAVAESGRGLSCLPVNSPLVPASASQITKKKLYYCKDGAKENSTLIS